MTIAFGLLGLVLCYYLATKISAWWEERAFRRKLHSLEPSFAELAPSTLAAGEQAIARLAQLAATAEAHPAYQRQLARRQAIRRQLVKPYKKKPFKRKPYKGR